MPFPIIVVQCADCRHLKNLNPYFTTGFCDAFGDRPIPRAILWGDHDHKEPFEGDNGITFEETPSLEEAIREMQEGS